MITISGQRVIGCAFGGSVLNAGMHYDKLDAAGRSGVFLVRQKILGMGIQYAGCQVGLFWAFTVDILKRIEELIELDNCFEKSFLGILCTFPLSYALWLFFIMPLTDRPPAITVSFLEIPESGAVSSG
jgi:hypothetical protein